MIKRRIAALAFSLAAALLAACGHAPVESHAPTSNAAAPAPSGAAGIVSLSKRLMANHRSLFSLVKNRYSYYVGGLLLAEYGADTGILRISSLRPNQVDLVCEYKPQGELFIDATTHPDKQAFTADCDRLVQALSADLAR